MRITPKGMMKVVWALMKLTYAHAELFYDQCTLWLLTGEWVSR